MAAEQILLSSSSFDGMREAGGFGQPLHTLYPQIRAVLAGQLGVEAADLLAEPVVDRARGRIDWYAEGDPEQSPMALNDLPEEQRRPILARIEQILGQGRELAERYAVSGDVQRMQLGVILKAALGEVVESGVFLVEGRPVMTGWGFAPDRPWETPAVLAHSAGAPAPDAVTPSRDVAIPNIALPERVSVVPTEPAPAPEAPPPLPAAPPEEASQEPLPAAPSLVASNAASLSPELGPLPKPEEPPPLPEPPLEPLFNPDRTPIPGVASTTTAEPSFKLDPAPVLSTAEQPVCAETVSASSLRYVVVGSSYFWGVFALALILVLAVAWWAWMKPAPYPLAGEPAARALAEAQYAETELRTRLESLIAQLAERRGQCRLPDGSAGVAPVMREPGGSRSAIPIQSTVAVAGGENPRTGVKAPVSSLAGVPAAEAPATTSGTDRSVALPTPIPAPDRATAPDTVISGDHATASRAASGRNSSDVPGRALASAPERTTSNRDIPTTSSRTLEELLADRQTPPITSVQQPPIIKAPVKAEPTPEERREFANRLSAAGAATGEISAALLWNGRSDLDLVVRCPSGRQLDYQHPAECGGALDVDANASRDKLSDRPVENAFWPAGKALPGAYEIAVRYIPRKDEQNPGETPFQLRLIRGGQESVFKGAIRPNATVPVTAFTVDR